MKKPKESAKLAGSTEPYLNEPLKIRWVEAYFPWTSPSWEIEVWWKGEWLECCGCGVVQQQVLLNSNLGEDKISWAFGIGLDRIAMLLFGIPDIRLFWTLDERFHKQFQQGHVSTFVPYSKYPGVKETFHFGYKMSYMLMMLWKLSDLMLVIWRKVLFLLMNLHIQKLANNPNVIELITNQWTET